MRTRAPSDVLALLAELVAAVQAQSAEIRGLRADLAASRVLRPIAAYDRDDAELLRAIAASSASEEFRVSELLETISDRAEDQRLRNAIVAVLGEVNPKRLGRLFRRVEGADIGSLCVARVGKKTREGVTWRVATFEPELVAKAVAPLPSKVKNCANGT